MSKREQTEYDKETMKMAEASGGARQTRAECLITDRHERVGLRQRLRVLDEKLSHEALTDLELLDMDVSLLLSELISEPNFKCKTRATEAQVYYLAGDIGNAMTAVLEMLCWASTEVTLKRLAIVYVQLMEDDNK